MPEPSVCAILLTADRLEFTRAAISDFRAQSYPNKSLVVWDTSDTRDVHAALIEDMRDREYYVHDSERLVIGQLRNRANSYACSGEGFSVPDVLLHLDSDDRNHPNRIAEQVALLQSSGADAIGYNEMLFWREPCKFCDAGRGNILPRCPQCGLGYNPSRPVPVPGEAWLYSNKNPQYALGTSLAYRREVWDSKPFEATSIGEDERFLRGLKVAAVTSIPQSWEVCSKLAFPDGPRMIARIHGQNTSTAYDPRKMESEARKTDGMWKRVQEWDSFCAETMK